MSQCLGARKRTAKGFHTGPNIWDKAASRTLVRGREKLDPGVNFFVLMLERMGLSTHYSCEGHPGGFYVTFRGPYDAALAIKEAGFFNVEIEGPDYWSIRLHGEEEEDIERERVDSLRWAADAWEERFGSLDFGEA